MDCQLTSIYSKVFLVKLTDTYVSLGQVKRDTFRWLKRFMIHFHYSLNILFLYPLKIRILRTKDVEHAYATF